MILSERLRNLRIRYGYLQEDMAKALSISRVAYTQYEAGRREPNLENLMLLSRIYNVTVDYLLGLSDIPRSPCLSSEEEFLFSQLDRLNDSQRSEVFCCLKRCLGEQILTE